MATKITRYDLISRMVCKYGADLEELDKLTNPELVQLYKMTRRVEKQLEQKFSNSTTIAIEDK